MKLSLIGPVYPYRGGIAHFTTMLVEELSVRCALQTISFKRLYPSWLYPGKSDKEPKLDAHLPNAKYLLDPLNPLTWWKTTRAICKFEPDVVVLEWWTTYLSPAYLFLIYWLRRKDITVLFLIHNVLPHEIRRADPFLTSLVLRRGQGHIVLTENEKTRLLALIPETTPVEVCTHPRYDLFAKQRVSKQEARKILDLPLETPILLFFGIVRPYKGVEYFVQSLAHLVERGIEVFSLIVGEWWMDQSECREIIRRSGLDNQVRIVDRYVPNEDVGYYFSAADVFIAPYVAGTQSGSVKIALVFDLALVVTEHIADGIQDANPELLYVVPARDSVSIADALERHLNKEAIAVRHLQDQGDWETLYQTICRLANFEMNKLP